MTFWMDYFSLGSSLMVFSKSVRRLRTQAMSSLRSVQSFCLRKILSMTASLAVPLCCYLFRSSSSLTPLSTCWAIRLCLYRSILLQKSRPEKTAASISIV